MVRQVAISAIFAAPLLIACGGSSRGDLIGKTVVATVTAAEIDAMTAGGKLQDLAGPAKSDVTIVQLNYHTAGARAGEMTNASAALLVPTGGAFAGPLPLMVYGRATKLGKAYTSADPSVSETRVLMIFFASQGYPVVATDYLGYALSAYPYAPYIHADSEASAIVDSVRAARQAAASLGLSLSGQLVLAGYSQGGHASMAAQRAMERDFAREFEIVGAAHMAGPYRMSAALLDGVSRPILGVQTFLPFEITAWQKVYGDVYVHGRDVFNAPYDAYVESLFPAADPASLNAQLPQGTPEQARDALFQASFLADLASDESNGAFVAARKQDLLGWSPKAPVLLCGGAADPTSSFIVNAQAAYEDFESRGADVTLLDVDSQIRQRYGAVLAHDPATYWASYHSSLESPFCVQAAKAFFDGLLGERWLGQ
jgi:pimeloyl-ACP methyl ester carboxylesterase